MSGQCEARVWPDGAIRSRQCSSKAKVERDGKHYCGRHDPVAREEKWAAKIKAENDFFAERRAQQAAEAERKKEVERRAELYPELLEALTEMLERYVSLVNSGDAGKWNPEDEPQVQQARAAIRKATGAAE